MSHPLLAKMHDVLLKIKNAFKETPYTDDVKGIIRTIEQVYVKTAKREAINTATQEGEDGQRLSLREKPAPKKTQKVYKLMRLGEDGKLYPLFIGSGAAVELGKWYDAESPKLQDLTSLSSNYYVGTRTVEVNGEKVKEEYNYGAYIVNNETGEAMSLADFKAKHGKQFARMGKNPNKDAVNWATDNGYRWIKIEEKNQGQSRYNGEARSYYNYGINGSGAVSTFAMRPGWHAGSLPTMRQIGKGSAKNLRDDTFVWVEGEIPADIDYNEEAQKNADKDIPDHIPTDGYYLKATNANKEASQADRVGWYVAGAFKANRIMSDKETRDVIDEWNAAHPDEEKVEYDWKRESGKDFNAETMSLEGEPKFSVKRNDNQKPLFGYFQGSIKDLIAATKTTGSNLIKKAISYANDKLITDLKAHGVNITKDYKHTIDNNSINHAMNRHSSEREKLQGQIPITENDLENIGDVIDNYDSIETERNNRGQDVIIYTKQYNDGTTYYIEEVRTGRKELAMQSIRKRKNRRFTDANSQATQISDLSSVSAANIANPSETSKGNAEKFSLRLQNAINETDTEPTEAQKKSGNYKKGHVKFGGYDYTIENPKGSYRSGVDENGKEWKQKMNDTYGYIRGKFGKDGDHLDMFINDKADLDSWNGDVFVVDQVNPDGKFDEHKVMYGYDSLEEAKKAYLSNYEKGWTGLGNITPVSKVGFDKWLDKSNRKLKPFADYADITSKTNMDTAPSSFDEFLEHPAVRYSIRNEKERAAAEDAYNFAQENRPDRYSRYAIVNMEKPGAVPQYLEKKAVADNWRRYYNKLKWGNYKLFDLDKPFEDNVKNLVGKFPETFRKKNDTTLSKINELTADYNKRKEEYDAMSNSIQELLNGLMKQGRSLAEAESVIRDWGLYKEMDSKYQNLMGIRKQLNELRSGKVADDERFSLIGKKGAEALDHAEEVSTRLDNLNVARQMEEAKKDAKAIKMATGWERGADGKWRYEIADSKLNDMMDVDGKGKMVKRHKEDMLWTSGKLGEVVVAPELFKAYPKLKDVRLETDSIMNNLPSNGEYNAKTNTITIHADELKYLDSILNHEIQHVIQDLEGFAQGGDSKHIRKVLERMINENQEASDYAKDKLKEWVTLTMAADRLSDLYKQYINSDNEWLKNKAIESYWDAMNELDNNEQSTLTNDYPDGTAREIAESGYHVDEAEKELRRLAKETKESIPEGNNSALDLVSKLTDALENNDDYNLYRKLGGEVEARNVQSRMGMSPEERRKTLAEETEDVARKDQIFLYGDSVSMMGSRAFNEAINSSDNIRFSLKSMMEKPEGWKQANKKAIHIAEAIERDPKFSLKNLDGTLIKAGTYFSGGGLVEEGLKGIIDPVVAVEYDEKISGVYRNNFGNHIVTADVRDVDPKELVGKIDGEVEYFHASPVCKNYSLAKNNHEELELDKETAASTAEFISKVRPKVVTIENVKGYKDSEAMKTITDALDEAGYKWDADVYNAADYGGYTNRERLIVRAVRDGELPAKPEKQKRKSGWYEAVEDIMPTLTEKKNGVAPWMDERLKADGIDWRHIDKPLYVMGSGYANGTVPHAFADELLPTLRTKSGDVIVMPDGKVYRAMGRVLARVSGVSDDYQMPASEALSHTIIGNGIPTQLTENVIAPLVRDVLHPAVEEKASLKDADRKQTQLDIILKTNPMLDDYHTGIRKVEDIKTLGESVEEARSEAEKYGDDEWSAYPDITNDMLQNALETGEITIYSSKPIKNGVFVTPSYMQASDYAGGGNVYEKTVPLTDVAWINTDEGQYAKVDGERYSLKEVNDKFNDRLAQLIENPNQKDRVLHLGRSSQFLIDGGIADAEIELDFDKFVRKSSEKYKNNHPFSAGDIKDLPKAIAHPVAVFNSTTKKDHVVMTELNHDGKNFIVAIRATEQNRKNKVVLEVNQITSLYPKGERGIIYWINNNKLSNVDKEKALHFIEALQPHAGTLTSEELSSAANIVRNFVNPKQNDGNLQKTERYSLRVDRYRDELNQWKKDNNLPKDAERPQLPVREPNDRLGFT